MVKNNFLKQKLSNNQQTIGTWSLINSSVSSDIISSCGIDFLIIDAEHGNFSYETAQNIVSVCEANNVSPIMRVGSIDRALILRALDIGVHGIQIPCITNEEDIKSFIKFAKYPPVGDRGFSPFTKAGLYDKNNSLIHTERTNDNILLIAGVESIDQIKLLDKIISSGEINVVFIGLYDLSKSMNIPGDIENPKLLEIVSDTVKKCHSHNIKIGSIATSLMMLEKLKSLQLDYITYSVDTGVLKEAYLKIIKKFKT